jgi:hypothetical protein
MFHLRQLHEEHVNRMKLEVLDSNVDSKKAGSFTVCLSKSLTVVCGWSVHSQSNV